MWFLFIGLPVGLGALPEDNWCARDRPRSGISGAIEQIGVQRHTPAFARGRSGRHDGYAELIDAEMKEDGYDKRRTITAFVLRGQSF